MTNPLAMDRHIPVTLHGCNQLLQIVNICGVSAKNMMLQSDTKNMRKPSSQYLRRKRSRGQTLVEYALILAFISVVAMSVLIRLGETIKSVFTTITSQLAVASSSH
jgi:Flp pilus assembly pilin Flp